MAERPVPTGRLRGPSGWSLRTRLLVATVALLASVSLVIGVVSVIALDRFLLGRLDDQLTAAAGRSSRAGDDPSGNGRGDGNDGPGPLRVQGQGEGTLGAVVADGEVVLPEVLDRDGDRVAVSADAAAPLSDVPEDGEPHTVDLGGDLGDYRVLASDGAGGQTFLTGLPQDPLDTTVLRLAATITAVAAVGILLAGLLGAMIIRRTLRPLRQVAATAGRVAELPLDRGEVALAERVPAGDTDPRTEVGQVGAALNRLLEHVAAALSARQASETRVRHFVADASHELRTPLAAIRGYSELARRTSAPVPVDVAHALGRVESEAQRMTGLVEDLLLLARLDTGRPLERAEVDLSRLVVDAVSDAHAAGPGHRWELDLPPEPVAVIGDDGRLHQVVANLLAHARVHTPPGTRVTVALSGGGRTGVELRVIDDGPGIPPELLPEVFERFARGDSSRSRAAGSTGLGLAIVAAVVSAHAGRVSVESAPGRTAFLVHLPLNEQRPPGASGSAQAA